MSLPIKTVQLLERLVDRTLNDLNGLIAEKTGVDPDIVDTQWFEDTQRRRTGLVEAQSELRDLGRSLRSAP